MLKFFKILVFAVMAVPATAQTDTGARDAALSLFHDLMFETDRGFSASELILSRSFASHLHGSETALTIAELNTQPAGYDPQSRSGATTGMLYFHLAQPIALLHDLGGTANQFMAHLMESRLYWLAGDFDIAYGLTLHLIDQMQELGISDRRMTSALADAAVLSWRAGNVTEAKQYLERAQVCVVPRCPQDMVFEWLGEKRWLRQTTRIDHDVDRVLEQALSGAKSQWPNNSEILADIHQEALLTSQRSGDVLATVIADLQAVINPDELSKSKRREFSRMAKRLVRVDHFAAYMMHDNSVASDITKFTSDGGMLVLSKRRSMSYFNFRGRLKGKLLRSMPLVYELLQNSGHRDDLLIAEVIRSRLIMATGDFSGAQLQLQALIKQAKGQGYSNAQLHAVLLDLWLAASLSDDPEIAAWAEQETLACRRSNCDQDLVDAFFKNASDLPQIQKPIGLNNLLIDIADPFIRTYFPGNMLPLADMYHGAGGGNRPMDAARYAGLSFRFAEQEKTISALELQKRAVSTMQSMIYAGQYSAAADVGDRTIAWIDQADQTDMLSVLFYRTRARAAFRLGDENAYGFYDHAVRLVIADKSETLDWKVPKELELDLLDTTYLDLLDKLLSGQSGSYDVLARLRYKQGRYQEAADLIQALRRGHELYGGEVSRVLEQYFESRQVIHLRAGNLDAYAAAQSAYLGVVRGENVPADHHLPYHAIPRLRGLAYQEATYREAANDSARAQYLRALGGDPTWASPWEPLSNTRDPEAIAQWEIRLENSWDSYSVIRDVIELRDNGNYEGAARWMRQFRGLAVVAEANGTYLDAQTLWQMAFTFARVGESDAAFDLMNRAARIAANLSFAGAGGADGGTLQLLERDRWRYLLFVDIAWAAVSGQSPDDMLVVSRY